MNGDRPDDRAGRRWPAGFAGAGVASGIKPSGKPDLGLIVCDVPAAWSGTFTRNAAAAAPVLWCREKLGHTVRAVVANSGNANACTGAAGPAAVETTAKAVAATLGCAPDEVLVASTGPIGVPLPIETLCSAVPKLALELSGDPAPFAEAILTTDTVLKASSAQAGGASVVGVAKGAAMLAPNMATMLAFVATDATLPPDVMHSATAAAVDGTFNSICVDACESTNDSFFVLSSGRVEIEPGLFEVALENVCRDLAEQMVRDAEGSTRLLRIRVTGAADDDAARGLARSIAASDLWRAAVHGADPNWGRVLSAMGAQDRSLDLSTVRVAIGDEPVFTDGEPTGSRTKAAEAMNGAEVLLACHIGPGLGRAEMLTTDLSPRYVVENAFGTS